MNEKTADTRIIHGFHAVVSRLRNAPDDIREIHLAAARQDARARDLLRLAEIAGVRVISTDTARLDGMAGPHNLGACLRVADAAGVHAVIAPKDRACGLNATVIKVASGAADTVPYITVTNLARSMRELKERDIWVVGTAGEAKGDLYAPGHGLGVGCRGRWHASPDARDL